MSADFIQDWTANILDIAEVPIALNSIITDLDCGGLERNFDTTRRAGEPGVVARPQGFSEIEVSFTAKILTKEFIKAWAEGVTTPISLQLTAALNDGAGVLIPYSFTATGYTMNISFGAFSDSEIEGEYSMMATKITQSVGATGVGQFNLIYDPRNYIYSINGVNQLAGIKTMLGLV
jgi:phage tail tube protein FII